MNSSHSTAQAKQALRTLATDADQSPVTPVVREATAALTDVEAAAEFLAADGATRLSRCVVQAVRDDDEVTVRRGREALAALHAFRAAVDGVDSYEAACTDGRRSAAAETDAVRRAPERGASAGSDRDASRDSLPPRSRNGFTGRWQTRG